MGIQINGQTDTISDSNNGFSLDGTNNKLRLYGTSSGYSDIIAAAGSASTTFTLPANGGSASQYLQTNGAGVLSWATVSTSNLTRGTAQSTSSGTGVTFTGIPSTARKITVMFDGVSTTGSTTNDVVIVQIGSGSITTTGYTAVWMYSNSGSTGTGNVSTGFPIANGDQSYSFNGWMILTNVSGNTWVAGSVVQGDLPGNDALGFGSGKITLGGTLDQLKITTVGSSFDGGSVNILYEVA
jgi:hypothetical protein